MERSDRRHVCCLLCTEARRYWRGTSAVPTFLGHAFAPSAECPFPDALRSTGRVSMAAQATPSVPRAYVAPGPDGIAHGTPADEDIFATGSGQTLNGGGGIDIFHLGTFT